MILPGFLWFSAHSERYWAVCQTAKQRSECALNHKKATITKTKIFDRISARMKNWTLQTFQYSDDIKLLNTKVCWRLVKRLYIPLPEGEARRRIINNLLAKERNSLTPTDVDEVVDKTEGYSGADMANLCKEAAMGPIRSLDFNAIDTMEASQVVGFWFNLYFKFSKLGETYWGCGLCACSEAGEGVSFSRWPGHLPQVEHSVWRH